MATLQQLAEEKREGCEGWEERKSRWGEDISTLDASRDALALEHCRGLEDNMQTAETSTSGS